MSGRNLRPEAQRRERMQKSARSLAPQPRTPEEDARIYGPPEFRDWLHAQPCSVCGWRGEPEEMQQCHVKTGGTGRKDEWTRTFPGCGPHELRKPSTINPGVFLSATIEGCHHESGRIGVKSFEKKHGVVLMELAAKTQADWNAFQGASA